MKKWRYILAVLGLMALCLITGCSNDKHQQTLEGTYQISQDDEDLDDNANPQPAYWYFKKDGTLLWAQPETGDDDHGSFGGAGRGTWKSLGNNKFRIHLEYIYDSDEFTFTAKKTGNRLHTYDNARDSKFEWDADDNYRQPQMKYADFMAMFNRAKRSAQEKVQQIGTDEADNDTASEDDSSTTKISNGNEALAYIKKQRGDHGFRLNGGTFGESDHPHASIADDDGNLYYVYEDGKIEEQ